MRAILKKSILNVKRKKIYYITTNSWDIIRADFVDDKMCSVVKLKINFILSYLNPPPRIIRRYFSILHYSENTDSYRTIIYLFANIFLFRCHRLKTIFTNRRIIYKYFGRILFMTIIQNVFDLILSNDIERCYWHAQLLTRHLITGRKRFC